MTEAWIGPVLGGTGAFLAAWFGAHLGFRRSRKERALDRTIGWHEQTIESLARYEEQLERLRKYSIQSFLSRPLPEKSTDGKKGLGETHVVVPEAMWLDLTDAEEKVRALLRLADLYTPEGLAIKCSVALSNTVNIVVNHLVHVRAEPTVAESAFFVKSRFTEELRKELQESLKVTLEIDGALAGLLGSRYRKWLKMRRIEKLRRDFRREQEASKARLEKTAAAP
jgi:hypothetical protein